MDEWLHRYIIYYFYIFRQACFENQNVNKIIVLECGPCASLVACAVCEVSYVDNELIIQCTQCRRWLHGLCDTIHNEHEADICCQRG